MWNICMRLGPLNNPKYRHQSQKHRFGILKSLQSVKHLNVFLIKHLKTRYNSVYSVLKTLHF